LGLISQSDYGHEPWALFIDTNKSFAMATFFRLPGGISGQPSLSVSGCHRENCPAERTRSDGLAGHAQGPMMKTTDSIQAGRGSLAIAAYRD
jgi:hypothetical protein